MNYCWAGPKRPGGPQRMRKRSPGLAPASAIATDIRDPCDSETDRGGGGDGGATRRRWHLRRVQRYYDVLLARPHLAVLSIEAIAAATGNGDGHGGARPWHGRLRRGDGATALVACSPSISSTRSS